MSDDTQGRLAALEEQLRDLASARQRNSDRVREVSQSDLEQSRALADEIESRKRLEQKVDSLLAIATRLDHVASNPIVKTIATVLATAFLSWAASKGLR